MSNGFGSVSGPVAEETPMSEVVMATLAHLARTVDNLRGALYQTTGRDGGAGAPLASKEPTTLREHLNLARRHAEDAAQLSEALGREIFPGAGNDRALRVA